MSTYSELRKLHYEQPELIKLLPNEEEQALEVIKILINRKGFEHWWRNMEHEYQDEIFDEIKALFPQD